MRSLFPEFDGASEQGFSGFEKKVVSGNIDWANFYSLKGEERENAIGLLLGRGVISLDSKGNFEVIRADSCRQDLSFDYHGKRVYFTDSKYVDSFRTFLELKGCVNIARRR